MSSAKSPDPQLQQSSGSTRKYLLDVFLCSLVAFGGPEAHLGVFLDRLVKKKKYLTEKALLEWMALCSFLPGPTSTQVITAIGLERGGRGLAILTLLIWAFPVILFMSLVAMLPSILGTDGLPTWLGFLAPMAGGFVGWAAWILGRKVATDLLTLGLWAHGFAVVMVSDSPWAIPLAFIAGGVLAVLLSSKQSEHGNVIAVRLPVPWGSVALFFGLLFIGLLGPYFWGSSLIPAYDFLHYIAEIGGFEIRIDDYAVVFYWPDEWEEWDEDEEEDWEEEDDEE